MAAWLAGIRSRQDLSGRLDQGFWLEQAIFQSLQAWRALDLTGRRLYFWRDRSGREVDFVLEKTGFWSLWKSRRRPRSRFRMSPASRRLSKAWGRPAVAARRGPARRLAPPTRRKPLCLALGLASTASCWATSPASRSPRARARPAGRRHLRGFGFGAVSLRHRRNRARCGGAEPLAGWIPKTGPGSASAASASAAGFAFFSGSVIKRQRPSAG